MKFFLLFLIVIGSKRDEHGGNQEEQGEHEIPMVKIEEGESAKGNSSQFIGVSWYKRDSKWYASRWSKIQCKMIYNGYFKADEETKAAYESDTLARALIADGRENHKLNFPNDETEVWAEKKKSSSKYYGGTWSKIYSKWRVRRWSKI
jgi:hypothetical protein